MASVLLISIFDELCKGLRYVAASLKDAGHEVEILVVKLFKDTEYATAPRNDEGFYGQYFYVSEEELHQTLEEIKRFNPDIIGLTVFSYFTGVAEWLTRHIKSQFKDVPIVWGGVDVTYNPERAIHTADIICLGEGEMPMVELVDALEESKDITDIKNLWIHKDGKVLKQPMRPLVENLDDLPIPLYNPGYSKIVRGSAVLPFEPEDPDYMPPYILSTRGCPSGCTFCYNGPMREVFRGQKFLRTQSVAKLIREIKALLSCYPNLKFLKFSDDVFGFDRQWTEEFVDKYKRTYRLPFNHYIHPTVTTFESLKLLREAGMSVIAIGVQTASRRILKHVFRRPFYKENILERIKWAKELDLWIVIELILYNPWEDETDLEQTFQLVCQMPKPIGFPMVSTLWLFENFPITRMAKEQGLPLRRIDNSNTYLSDKELALNAFYMELIKFAALEYAPLEALEKIRRDRIFFQQPQLIGEIMSQSLFGQARRINEAWVSKDKLINDLERQLNRIKGSRLHHWAEQFRQLRKKISQLI